MDQMRFMHRLGCPGFSFPFVDLVSAWAVDTVERWAKVSTFLVMGKVKYFLRARIYQTVLLYSHSRLFWGVGRPSDT